MFPFFGNPCWSGSQSCSRKDAKKHQLEFLKSMRDNLEARLAGLNAAIETMERQMSQEPTES